jgi:hypothetical protein
MFSAPGGSYTPGAGHFLYASFDSYTPENFSYTPVLIPIRQKNLRSVKKSSISCILTTGKICRQFLPAALFAGGTFCRRHFLPAKSAGRFCHRQILPVTLSRKKVSGFLARW